MRRHPFRALAAILLLHLAGEAYAIVRTPTYEKELALAQARYESVLRENRYLTQAVNQGGTR